MPPSRDTQLVLAAFAVGVGAWVAAVASGLVHVEKTTMYKKLHVHAKAVTFALTILPTAMHCTASVKLKPPTCAHNRHA